jgi:selenocysteine lyase/cysteine desulfurase
MNWAEQRARFPVLDRMAYLNAGTFGPLSRQTLDAMRELRDREAVRGRSGPPYVEEMLARRDRVRSKIAQLIRAPDESVALTDSTTHGVHIVVTGLLLRPEDEIVTTDCEHFGLLGPVLACGAQVRLAKVRFAPASELADRIAAEVTPRTRLLALSAVSWLDGTSFPWQELRERTGVPVLVDGAQSVGALPVDVRAADFYTVSCQKWMCGPDATGALFVRDPEALAPRLIAYPSAASFDAQLGTWEPKPGALRFDATFTPASSLAGLEAALTDLPEGRFDRARELAAECRTLLLDAGHDVVTQPGQSTLVSVRLPGDTKEVVARLYEAGVVVRELPGTGLLRASVGWWNDTTDLKRLVEGLVR